MLIDITFTSEGLNMTQSSSSEMFRKIRYGMFRTFLAGMASAFAICIITVIQLDLVEIPAILTMRSSDGRRLVDRKLEKMIEKNYNPDFRDMNTCPLMILGKEFEDDKFYHHTFGDLYCENLSPFRNSRQKLRMLEIGLGCGHHNHGRSAQGATDDRLANQSTEILRLYQITLTTELPSAPSSSISMEEIFHG